MFVGLAANAVPVFRMIRNLAGISKGSCVAAQWQSLEGDWPEGMDVLNTFNEAYMDLAVETQTDMIFMSERFCGWGYKHKDANNVCYDPDAENLFDLTCIHPTTAGDKVIADMFYAVIDE